MATTILKGDFTHLESVKQTRWIAVAVLTLGLCIGGLCQSLTWLGTLGGGSSSAHDVSRNGIVVGNAVDNTNFWRAFRWENGSMTNLSGTVVSAAFGISESGSFIVGYFIDSNNQYRGYRWPSDIFGTLGGNSSFAYQVSANGSVVVGESRNASNQLRAFCWENGVMNELLLPGTTQSRATGVSADGSVIVGEAVNTSNFTQAFRWHNGTVQWLGFLPGGSYSSAQRVSPDGSTVVGRANNSSGQPRAFRWKNGVISDLGTLGGDYSWAYDASMHGSAIIGGAADPNNQVRAFRWTETNGMEDLNLSYASLLSNGSILDYAFGISPYGRFIVGQGLNAYTGRKEAYLLDTCAPHNGDVNLDGCVDDADLIEILFAFGQMGDTGRADVNCDGIVDDSDLLIVMFNFGSGC